MAVNEIDRTDALAALKAALAMRRADQVRDILRGLPPPDIATTLDALSATELSTLVILLGDEGVAAILEELEAVDAARLLLKLSHAQAADLLEEMAPDDAADVVEELEPSQAEAILVEMEEAEAEDLRELLAYPPDTAGGRMTVEYVSVSPNLTVEEALVAIRALAQEAETIYYVYVTDANDHLLGVLSLRDLVLSAPTTPISQITNRDVVKVRATDDQEVAARLLADRGFLALPVVDEQDRLLGIITADDVADVLEEEATEDIERLGGSEPLDEPYLHTGVLTLVRKRLVWLLVLFLGGALTSNVLSHFQATLSEVVELAFFIPLLIGTGGNVGSQIVSTLVRAMGVGEVRLRDLIRVLRKELSVALLIGALMGVVTYARAWTLGVEGQLGLAVALTALFIVLWSSTVSAVLPLVLRRLGVDPAVVSAPLITTLVDATGLFLYFSIAGLVLQL